MITNLSLNDKTQELILETLKGTERLLQIASGSDDVEIIVMTDACPAHNVKRMLDGHFTGTVTNVKNPKEPFIPIGTTVNVCGVTIFKLRHEISVEDFKSRVYSAMNQSPKPYTWNNFNRGNHFVSLMYCDGKTGYLENGQYLVVHASSNEYRNKLYPNKGVWYEDQIKKVILPDDPKRSLHYITGSTAEKFYSIAKNLLSFNQKRNSDFCEYVLKGIVDKEILNVQHYGMPDRNTICIGAQWETSGIVPLLTAPGQNIYLVKPRETTKYFPHGLGVEIYDGDIHYTKDGGICIGKKVLYSNTSLSIGVDAFNRAEKTPLEICISNILAKNPAKIVAELKQIASISARGFEVWNG